MERKSEMLPVAPGGATGEEVISEKLGAAIEALRERGMGKKAMARELGLDVKTVRKWCRQAWRPQVRLPRGRRLARWEPFLRGRAPEVGFNAAVLQRELVERGATCSYRAVAHYIAPWRAEWHGADLPTVRFETGPGEQAQVDWGTTWAYLGEERTQLHVFSMVLGYSRRLFARAYRSEGLGPLLDAHAAAFAHFGGRTETILYDNPRTIVLSKDEAAGQVVWNATFKDRMDFYGVKIRLCRYYRAQTSERAVHYSRYSRCAISCPGDSPVPTRCTGASSSSWSCCRTRTSSCDGRAMQDDTAGTPSAGPSGHRTVRRRLLLDRSCSHRCDVYRRCCVWWCPRGRAERPPGQ
jgi:transposase